MKTLYPSISMAEICSWFGMSRQAYYQDRKRMKAKNLCAQLVIQRVKEIRKNHPRMGGRKLYEKLKSFFEEHLIKMGRDAFFTLLYEYKLLIRPRKNRRKTTDSDHDYLIYPNQIKDLVPTAPHQVWVSDMTYWRVGDRFLYLSLITDAYSRYIVGYHLAHDLKAVGPLAALRMALDSRALDPQSGAQALIHHSDRGVQYCCHAYTGRLKTEGIKISMAAKGNPLENAIAERVNGILKHEYLFEYNPNNDQEAARVLKQAIHQYNSDRPHESLHMRTPEELHLHSLKKETHKSRETYTQPNTAQL